jgi:hypothetical protein
MGGAIDGDHICRGLSVYPQVPPHGYDLTPRHTALFYPQSRSGHSSFGGSANKEEQRKIDQSSKAKGVHLRNSF